MPDGFGLIVAAVIALFLILFFCVTLLHGRNLRFVKEQEIAMKQAMLAKGMSAADIERVIQASAAELEVQQSGANAASQQGPGFAKTHLIQILAENSFDAAEIETLLHALMDFPDDELPAKIKAVETMVENSMNAAGIERVIRAFRRVPVAPDVRAGEGEWHATRQKGRENASETESLLRALGRFWPTTA